MQVDQALTGILSRSKNMRRTAAAFALGEQALNPRWGNARRRDDEGYVGIRSCGALTLIAIAAAQTLFAGAAVSFLRAATCPFLKSPSACAGEELALDGAESTFPAGPGACARVRTLLAMSSPCVRVKSGVGHDQHGDSPHHHSNGARTPRSIESARSGVDEGRWSTSSPFFWRLAVIRSRSNARDQHFLRIFCPGLFHGGACRFPRSAPRRSRWRYLRT